MMLAAGASAGGHNEALMKEVEAFGDALAKAMVANDVEFLLGLYAEGAISLPNYGPRMEGMDAFKKSHEEMAAVGMKVTSFESQPTEVWECGDQVIEIGKFAIDLEMAGMDISDKGKYLTIYERDANGSLKIKVETWNTDLNPMQVGGGEHDPGHDHEHGEH
jgi:ketosteroid isomerase-like protein